MIRVLLSGCGRMGKRVVALASQSQDIRVVGALEVPGSSEIGRDVGEVSLVGKIGAAIWPADDIERAVKDTGAEVFVDFTNAEASALNVPKAAMAGLRIVMGTTGHSDAQMRQIVKAIEKGKVAAVISPNMSAGVTVLLEACEVVAKMLPGYDVEVSEIHHNQKLDAPSGTALKIADQIARALGRDPSESIVAGRAGKGKRRREEIGVSALRAGDVVGDHTVIFAGVGERIELVHRAHSRDAFAAGVIRSVRFVSEAEPGIYSIRDVLLGG